MIASCTLPTIAFRYAASLWHSSSRRPLSIAARRLLMSWTTNCATSAIASTLARPRGATAPRVSDHAPVWHKIPETSPLDPTSGISTHLDATAIADATHPCAESTLHSKRDGGAVYEHDGPDNETPPIVSLICMSNLLACDRSTERQLWPVHEGGRR
jgi:hypothetical protein